MYSGRLDSFICERLCVGIQAVSSWPASSGTSTSCNRIVIPAHEPATFAPPPGKSTTRPCKLSEKPLSSNHCRLSQPTARHSGVRANPASGHAKGRHCLTGSAKSTSPHPAKGSADAAELQWSPGSLPLPLRRSHPPRRTCTGTRHFRLGPAMARADLLIELVRAGAEGNQELFRYSPGGLVSQWHSGHQHVASLPGGAREKPPKSHAATGACDNPSRLVALIPWSLRTPAPPPPPVTTPQRRRATTRRRGAAGSARIASNTPFLASPRPARPHPGHRWPCSRSDRPLLLLCPPHPRRAQRPHPPTMGHPPHRCLGGDRFCRCSTGDGIPVTSSG